METVTTERSTLKVSQIRTDGGTQPRASIDDLVVEDYASVIKQLPPVSVFYDGTDYWLADGFHRLEAYKFVGTTKLAVEIRQGTRRDAVLFSVGANADHGLRRSDDDKRRAVITLLNDPEWQKWSDREIARRCIVSHPYVSKLRSEKAVSGNRYQIDDESVSSGERKATRNGITYTVQTTKIGRSNPKAATQPEESELDEDKEDDTSSSESQSFAYRLSTTQPTKKEKKEPITRPGQPAFPPGQDERREFGPFQDRYCEVDDFFRWVQNLGGIEGATQGWSKEENEDMAVKLEYLCEQRFLTLREWIAYLRREE